MSLPLVVRFSGGHLVGAVVPVGAPLLGVQGALLGVGVLIVRFPVLAEAADIPVEALVPTPLLLGIELTEQVPLDRFPPRISPQRGRWADGLAAAPASEPAV